MIAIQATRRYPGALAALLGAAGLAWWWTVARMSGMDGGPGADLGALGWFTGSWVVMMAAMMLPSFAPSLAAYTGLTRGGAAIRRPLFIAGYLLAWTACGIAAYGVFALGRELFGDSLAWQRGGRWLAGGVLLLAAAYQFTPLKRACLSRCRGRLDERAAVRTQNWPDALAMGVRSAGWCVGCSWALMAALFALGAMSLTWMGLIAVLVAVEKTGPRPFAARLATATVLAALAVGVLAAPGSVPGFVVPGSAPMHAMSAMPMSAMR